jgi:hypothetical protein
MSRQTHVLLQMPIVRQVVCHEAHLVLMTRYVRKQRCTFLSEGLLVQTMAAYLRLSGHVKCKSCILFASVVEVHLIR